MATAGLRLVGEAVKDQILQSVCSELEGSGFIFRCEWASVLDGQDEGLYGWVTVNYLLDRLYPGPPEPPVGIIDLGGGSVQIVLPSSAEAPEGYKKDLDFAGRQHSVYIKSHLGYGLNEARSTVLEQLTHRSQANAERPVRHPCLPKDLTLTHKGVEIAGEGDFKRCTRLIRNLLFPQTPCKHKSCSFGGVFQPALPASVYGFSYMYDRTAAIGLLDGEPKEFGEQAMSVSDIEAAGAKVCMLSSDENKARFKSTKDASKSETYCGDVAYLSVLLGELGFEPASKLVMTNKIKDVELVWTLGAMLAKSAELAAAARGSLFSKRNLLLLIVVAGIAYTVYRKLQPTQTYSSLGRDVERE